MTHRRWFQVLLATLMMAGCAAMGGGGGGAENLPNRGIVPYDRVGSDDEDVGHYVLESEEPQTLIHVEPHAALTREDSVVLFAEARTLATGAGSVVRCELGADLRCTALETVLDPGVEGAEWLLGRAGAPCTLRQDDTWLMAFAYGDGEGIGLAWSIDGVAFVLDDTPLLVATGPLESQGIDSPSLIRTMTGYRLYYEGRDAEGVSRILVADGDHGLLFERVGVALDAGIGCLDVAGQPSVCWDAAGVSSPEVRVAVTPTGREVFRLFYTGMGDAGFDLGFAASWDGVYFERFAYNPVIASDATERQPTNIRLEDRYLLFFEERVSNTVRGIGIAINDAPAPSETF